LENTLLWGTLKEIHAAGILHHDLEPRNIVGGPVGPTTVDFSHLSFHECTGPGKCKELVRACKDIWGGYDPTYWPVKYVKDGGWLAALVKCLADMGRRLYRVAS